MKILLVDDHKLVLETLGAYLETTGDFVVKTAVDLNGAFDVLDRDGPFDLILLDYSMPGSSGLEAFAQMLNKAAGTPVAVISGIATLKTAKTVLSQGAIGFVPKTLTARSFIEAVRLMVSGTQFVPADIQEDSSLRVHAQVEKLSVRESQVLGGLCRGLSNKEIAREVDLQEVTIKLHVKTLCRKLTARNRTHAAIIAKEAGLV